MVTSLRSLLWAWILIELLAAGAVQAEETLLRQVTRGEQGLFQFDVAGGRVTLTCRQPVSFQTSTGRAQRKETLSANNENGRPSLSYEQVTPEEQLKIEVATATDRVLLRRAPRGKSAFVAVEYLQAGGEAVTLTLGTGTGRQVLRAPGLWQLWLARPEECRQHLLPLLEVLRPNWRIGETASQVEKSLIRLANTDSASDRTRWSALVGQLGDESFARREAADRALRAGGVGALAYLRQLDFNSLDAEQQLRVARILETLGPPDNADTAEQVARLLASEPLVWLALLGRPDLATRQTAARQLATLLSEPILVDPAADPDSQKDKREQLRARIDGRP